MNFLTVPRTIAHQHRVNLVKQTIAHQHQVRLVKQTVAHQHQWGWAGGP